MGVKVMAASADDDGPTESSEECGNGIIGSIRPACMRRAVAWKGRIIFTYPSGDNLIWVSTFFA